MASLWEGFLGKKCVFLVCGNPTPISTWWLGQRYWLLDLWHCMQGSMWIWIQDSDWCWHNLHPLHAHPRRMCTSPKFVHMLCRCAYQGAFLANEICFFAFFFLNFDDCIEPLPPYSYNHHLHTHIQLPPPHSASCLGASEVCAPVGERKMTTSPSCNGGH